MENATERRLPVMLCWDLKEKIYQDITTLQKSQEKDKIRAT
jgi:hypothetical protein